MLNGMMRWIGFLLFSLPWLAGCNKDEGKSGETAPSVAAPAETTESAAENPAETILAPTYGGTVKIQLEPAAGAPVESIANASLAAEGRPEITGTSDASGIVTVTGVQPGTVVLYVTSGAGASLTTAAAAYGVKFSDVLVKNGEVTDLGKQAMKKTGSLTGKVTFFSNPNNLDLTGSEVFVPGTGFIAKTDAKGSFTLNGLPPGKYSLRAQRTGFAVLDLRDLDVTEGTTTDLGDLILSLSNGPEGRIELSGADTVTIRGKEEMVVKTANRAVNFALTYDSDAALMKISDEPSFINREWAPVSATGTWTDFTTDGPKSLYVMFSDLNGLESSPFKVEFFVDTEAPVAASVSILNGWDQLASTASSMRATVSASDSGTGIAKMMVCTTNTFDTCGTWVDFAEEATGIPVASTIYVKLKDFAGHVSSVTSDAINLGSHTIIAGGTYTKNLTLYQAQSPFRFDSDIIAQGNLTIEGGVTLDHAGASNKSIKVNGRLLAKGSSSAKIVLTSSNSKFGSFDLSDSVADNNELSFIDVGAGVLSISPFIKINGGTVSDIVATGGSQYVFLQKSGYKSLTVSRNTLTDLSMIVSGGSVSISKNNISNGTCPAFSQTGGTGTVFSYNTVSLSCNAGDSNDYGIIYVSGGNITLNRNDLQLDLSHMFSIPNAVGLILDDVNGATATFTHNNLDVQNSGTASNMRHFGGYSDPNPVFTAADNYFAGKDGTTPVFDPSEFSTPTNNQASPWPVTGAGCVGHLCNE